MQNKTLKIFGLSIFFPLWVFSAQLTDGLLVHPVTGSFIEKIALDNIERITFSDGDMSIQSSDGNVIVYLFTDISKITFDKINEAGINNPVSELDIIVYVSSMGELVVNSSSIVKSLTLFSIDGKIVQRGTSSTMFIGSLPASAYILRIETEEGAAVKKIIR